MQHVGVAVFKDISCPAFEEPCRTWLLPNGRSCIVSGSFILQLSQCQLQYFYHMLPQILLSCPELRHAAAPGRHAADGYVCAHASAARLADSGPKIMVVLMVRIVTNHESSTNNVDASNNTNISFSKVNSKNENVEHAILV